MCDMNLDGPTFKPQSISQKPGFNDCIAECASQNYFQNRNDISAVYSLAYNDGHAPGSCMCVGGLGANVTRTLTPNTGKDVALIQ
jgi:hypothetical protein